jgi:GH18 family chitinase
MKYYSLIWITAFLLCFQTNRSLAQEFKTVGYFPTYRFSLLDQIKFDQLTHMTSAFANPDAEGVLRTDGISIHHVVQQAHANQIEVYIALAGGAARLSTWENWIKPPNRSDFISGIMAYVQLHNLDGVDVDLEWSVVNADYSGFVLELKDSLDTYGLGMTAALPGTYRYPEITDEALAAFDWVNLMVYDLTGPWDPSNPGPHSPYSFAERSISYWQSRGLEKDRMTLGMPFYAYDFTDLNNVRAYTYNQMVKWDNNNAQVDQLGEIYYNGLPTIARKTELALEQALAGVMVWELGQDYFGEFSLMNRIAETIAAYFATTPTQMVYTPPLTPPFPNPFTASLNVRGPWDGAVEVSLYSDLSRLLLTRRYTNPQDIRLELNAYPSGIYLLTLKTASAMQTFKVIKR